MQTLESCGKGRDNTSIEINQTNVVYYVSRRIDLIRRKIGLGQHINRIGIGVGDETTLPC